MSTSTRSPDVLSDPVVNLRRASVICAGLGVVGVVGSAFAGHLLLGLFACLGMAMGAINNRMLQRAVQSYADLSSLTARHFRRGVLKRLMVITVIAVGAALLVRPDGLGVIAGLAVFQVVMMIVAAVPVFRSLRPS